MPVNPNAFARAVLRGNPEELEPFFKAFVEDNIGEAVNAYTKSETDALLEDKADSAALAAKADVEHDHSIADVSGLQSALNGKAGTEHGHAVADVSGLQSALNEKADTAALAAKADASAVYTQSEVDSLLATLEARIAALEEPVE